jgi:hypothetical protein
VARNLIDPGDCEARVTVSGGRVYVSWQTCRSGHRASFTVTEHTAEVIDNQYPYLTRSDIVIVAGFLRTAGKKRLAGEIEKRYRELD